MCCTCNAKQAGMLSERYKKQCLRQISNAETIQIQVWNKVYVDHAHALCMGATSAQFLMHEVAEIGSHMRCVKQCMGLGSLAESLQRIWVFVERHCMQSWSSSLRLLAVQLQCNYLQRALKISCVKQISLMCFDGNACLPTMCTGGSLVVWCKCLFTTGMNRCTTPARRCCVSQWSTQPTHAHCLQAGFRTQTRALFYKNAAFQWHNKITNLRLVLTPIGIVQKLRPWIEGEQGQIWLKELAMLLNRCCAVLISILQDRPIMLGAISNLPILTALLTWCRLLCPVGNLAGCSKQCAGYRCKQGALHTATLPWHCLQELLELACQWLLLAAAWTYHHFSDVCSVAANVSCAAMTGLEQRSARGQQMQTLVYLVIVQ